jgi:hypothetical protein
MVTRGGKSTTLMEDTWAESLLSGMSGSALSAEVAFSVGVESATTDSTLSGVLIKGSGRLGTNLPISKRASWPSCSGIAVFSAVSTELEPGLPVAVTLVGVSSLGTIFFLSSANLNRLRREMKKLARWLVADRETPPFRFGVLKRDSCPIRRVIIRGTICRKTVLL